MYNLGLIGFPLSHSFSKKYFDYKFKKEKINNFSYALYPIQNLKHIQQLITENKIIGLNVTRPYKTKIIKIVTQVHNSGLWTLADTREVIKNVK